MVFQFKPPKGIPQTALEPKQDNLDPSRWFPQVLNFFYIYMYESPTNPYQNLANESPRVHPPPVDGNPSPNLLNTLFLEYYSLKHWSQIRCPF